MRSEGTPVRRGYTLIEVLIVVTIIGLASAVIVPHLLAASVLGVQAASRTLIADLLYAQNEAIAQQTPHRVILDTDNEQYYLQRQDADGEWPVAGDPNFKLRLNWREGGADNLIDFANDARFEGITLARATAAGANWNFTEDSGLIIVTFDELGSPTFGADEDATPGVSMGLIAEKDRYVITVAPFTGRVTIRRP